MNKSQVLAALNANKSARAGARLSVKKVYTVSTAGDITTKLAPQAIALLEIMFGEEQDSWTEVELNALMLKHTEISVKQSPWLVFKFYRAQLVEAGFLSITE